MGPFCRTAADCAAVYDVIRGRDSDDPGSRDAALPDPAALNVSGLTVGMLPSAQEWGAEVRRRSGQRQRPCAFHRVCLTDWTRLSMAHGVHKKSCFPLWHRALLTWMHDAS